MKNISVVSSDLDEDELDPLYVLDKIEHWDVMRKNVPGLTWEAYCDGWDEIMHQKYRDSLH